MYEQLHTAGYVFNDLKMDNLYVANGDKITPFDGKTNCLKNCQIYLVDFGLSEPFLDDQGNHVSSN